MGHYTYDEPICEHSHAYSFTLINRNIVSTPFRSANIKTMRKKEKNICKTQGVAIVFSPIGEMAERSNAAVLKTVEGQPSQGSNPCLSAKFLFNLALTHKVALESSADHLKTHSIIFKISKPITLCYMSQ